MAAGTAASTAAARQAVLLEAARSGALKWLLLGALGGGALIAAWMSGGQAADPAPVAQVAVPMLTLPDVAPHEPARREIPQQQEAAPARDSAGSLPPLLEVSDIAVADTSSAARLAQRANPVVGRRRAVEAPPRSALPSKAHRSTAGASARSGAPEPSSPPTSTLDAEVAALDAVRTAIAAAAFQRALRLIEQYRQDFPAGELARDADVFEIETLTAQGERGEATRQAERFLARYPNDPHLARVRGLVGQ
jgi:hypothetical protein